MTAAPAARPTPVMSERREMGVWLAVSGRSDGMRILPDRGVSVRGSVAAPGTQSIPG